MNLSFSNQLKIFLYSQPCDMRKGFDGLFGLVVNEMELDPLGNYLFVFISKNRSQLKMLYWEGDGFALYNKRLEQGTFRRPTAQLNAPNSELSQEEIFMILRGIDFEKTKKRKRYFTTK